MPRTAFLQYAWVRSALRGVRCSNVRLLIELFCLHISLCILLGGLSVRENREAFSENNKISKYKIYTLWTRSLAVSRGCCRAVLPFRRLLPSLGAASRVKPPSRGSAREKVSPMGEKKMNLATCLYRHIKQFYSHVNAVFHILLFLQYQYSVFWPFISKRFWRDSVRQSIELGDPGPIAIIMNKHRQILVFLCV